MGPYLFPKREGVVFYCSGCGNEIEELSSPNRVLHNIIHDEKTGKYYHNTLCKLIEIKKLKKNIEKKLESEDELNL